MEDKTKQAKNTIKNIKENFEISGGKYRIGWRNTSGNKKLVKVDDYEAAIIMGNALRRLDDMYDEISIYEKGEKEKELLTEESIEEIFIN